MSVETTPLRLTRRGWAAVTGLAVACALALGASVSVHDLCDPVDVSDPAIVSDEELTDLLQQGWTGNPHDGLEAIYAPGCV